MNMRAFLFAGALAFCAVAQAKTVAWYRFEEEPCGTVTTGETTFTNTLDAAKYPAYARVMTANGNNKYGPSTLSTDPTRMPIYTNAFPETIALINAADCSRMVPNRRAVDLRNPVNNHSNPASVILIDDHEDLRLKTFTLEFFARIPDTSAGWRTLVKRNGGAYSDKRNAFQITTSCLSGADAKLYFLFAVATTNDAPLYNASGVVTNATVANTKYSTSDYTFDNDKWHHIALTVDDTEKKVKLYVDYTLRSTLTFTGSLYYEPGYPISFGGDVQCSYY